MSDSSSIRRIALHSEMTRDSELAALRAEVAELKGRVALYEGTLESRDRNIADLVEINKEAERKLAAWNALAEDCERCGP